MDIGILPEEIRLSAISLKSLGVNSYAWDFENALKVIEYCREHNIVILGGDVYLKNSSNLRIIGTLNNWYYEIEPEALHERSVFDSCALAKAKVEFFAEKQGEENALFDLVVEALG